MPPRARIYGTLLVAACLTSTGATVAQEVQFDTNSLDTKSLDTKSLDTKSLDASGASAQAKRKGKKGADAAAPQAAPGKPAANGPNRQFGELEGWSPGKAPPKTKEEQQREQQSSSPRGGVNMTPSGSMGVGLPF